MSTPSSPEGRVPGVGDIVMYHGGGSSQMFAAIVTQVLEPGQHQSRVDLTIFKADSQEYRKAVRHAEGETPEGCWRWRPE